jgi:hypothetical protein
MTTTSYNKDLSKPWNQTVPKSMRDGGANLDEICGSIEQASAGEDGAAEETEANEPASEAFGAAENMAEVMSQPVRVAAQGIGAALMESDKKRGRR